MFSKIGEDFCMIVEITGKTGRVRVGINSAGDVASDIKIAIDAFISNGCDIIISSKQKTEEILGVQLKHIANRVTLFLFLIIF